MEILYNGITVSTRSLIDAAAGGTMNKKTPNEVYELIEEMASNMYQYPVERSARGRVSAEHNAGHVFGLQAQVESLTKQLTKLHTPSLVAQICELCGGGHPNHECEAENVPQEIMMKDSLERCLAQSCIKEDDDPLMQQEVAQLEVEENKEEEKGAEIKDPSKLELKPLPSSLKYVYLEDNSKPVIISSCLNAREEQLLIDVLSKH
ncbi:hypothetical protein H6P81_016203 [Aristolochia fimbriata]|uniref:Reverse transcriptase domain-containing protein n=1 Tax=Aristolochia fimbriata TaxID=158543 RepID=A0AAV7E7R5_ARIFI|nr:hypothetical protein H6P81_016203 [Aristolochia fimbriata]